MMEKSAWRVLVVEDEYDSIQMVSKILHYHGIEVQVARNGQECLAFLGQFEPTLILTDLAMPTMDGWQTLKAIQSDPKTSHIPVIAVTAYHSLDVAREAAEAGFLACFSKPVMISARK